MRKKLISVFLIYIIVFSGLMNSYIYADSYDNSACLQKNAITCDGKPEPENSLLGENDGSKKSDRIIVSLGDSYSSGEGIEPFYGQQDKNGKNLEFSEKVKNDDWLAHRSTKAWSGMLKLKGVNGTMADNRDTHWFFTAVSGAETTHIKYLSADDRVKAEKLLKKEKLSKNEESKLEEYGYQKKTYDRNDVQGTKWLEPQLNIFDQLGDKKADYVTISIGGNDLGFEDVISQVVTGISYSDKTELASTLYSALNKIEEDGETTKALTEAFLRVTKIAGPDSTVIVVGYPKLFEKNGKGAIVSKKEAVLVNGSIVEFDKALKRIVKKSNSEYEDDAKIEFVSLIDAGVFNDHEAYSKDPYINKVSFIKSSEDLTGYNLAERDVARSSSMHPNEKGAKAYAKCVQKKIDELDKGYVDDSILSKYKGEYLKILKANKEDILRYDWQFRKDWGKRYPVALYDIDHDSIPELFFITSDEWGGEGHLHVYSCNDKSGYELFDRLVDSSAGSGNMGYYIMGDRDESIVYCFKGYADDFKSEEYDAIAIKNGVAEEKEIISHYYERAYIEGEKEKDNYTKNGENISKQDFEGYVDQIVNNSETIIFDGDYSRHMSNPLKDESNYMYTYDEAISILSDGQEESTTVEETIDDYTPRNDKEAKACDKTAAGTVLTATQTCMADEDCYSEIAEVKKNSQGDVLILSVEGGKSKDAIAYAAGPNVEAEIKSSIGSGISIKYKKNGAKYYNVYIDGSDTLAVYISPDYDGRNWQIYPKTDSEYK